MPVWYVYGTGFRELKKGRDEINLWKGPIYSEDEARKKGFEIFGEEFELYKTTTIDAQRAKAEYKSKRLDKTGNISDSIQPMYNARD